MATQMRIAAAAFMVASGLLAGGTGASMAFADPDTGHTAETGGGQPAQTGGAGGSEASEPSPTSARPAEPTEAATPGATGPRSTGVIGDGRNGLVTEGPVTTRTTVSPSKFPAARVAVPSQGTTAGTSEPRPAAVAPAPTTESSSQPTTTTGAPAPPKPVGWPWPWWWPKPSASGVGSGHGGRGSPGTPGIGIPNPLPPMQLPRPPAAPALPVGQIAGAITGLATAAAELPFALPAGVPPVGAGRGGAAALSPGPVLRPGLPSARVAPVRPGVQSQPSVAVPQTTVAAKASDRAMPASYRAGYGDYLRNAGVGQIAAVAVPGVTGILALTGAGGLVGYRQARAGRLLRVSSTSRFMG